MTDSHFFAGRAMLEPFSDGLHGSNGTGAAGGRGAWPSWSRRASLASASSCAPAFRGAAHALQASPPELTRVQRAHVHAAGAPLPPSESSAVRSMGDGGALRLAGRRSAGGGGGDGAGRRAAGGGGVGRRGSGAGGFSSAWLSWL